MLTGGGVIGLLAGSLANLFRLEPVQQKNQKEKLASSWPPFDDIAPAVVPTAASQGPWGES